MKELTVHFFKPSGKWYTTETCTWNEAAQEALDAGDWRQALRCILPLGRLEDMVAVVIDSPLGFPAMLK